MSAVAQDLANALLAHHRAKCQPNASLRSCLITYGALCRNANRPTYTRGSGRYLREVAEWCQQRSLPPINALAVNGKRKKPGPLYDVAPGCSITNWPSEAQSAIDCTRYPQSAP